jgi:DNA mismatch repair ATPase MutS
MLHRVAPGPCDESFGIACAEAARLPPSVVAAARAKAAALAAGDATEPGAKRPRVERAPGAVAAEARARAFLKDFAALPAGGGRADAARALVAALAADAADMPELRALVPAGL